MTKKSMLASIDVAMGGRAAEELFIGNDEVQYSNEYFRLPQDVVVICKKLVSWLMLMLDN
jgi:hypothetical protein